MPIEVKDIITYFGMDDKIDSIDKFQEIFSTSFIKKDPNVIFEDKDLSSKILGRKTGVIETSLKRAMKRNGLELKPDEIKDSYIEDVIELAIDKAYKTNAEKVRTLEDQLSKGSDEKQKSLQAQLEKTMNDFKTLEGSYQTVKTEYDTFKQKKDTEIKDFKKGIHVDKLLGTIEWGSSVKEDELKKEGFISQLNKKFKFDLDENDNFIALNEKGEKIPNPKMNSTFKSPEEVVKEFAVEKGVWAINPHDQRQQTQQRLNDKLQPPKTDPKPGQGRRVVNPMIPTGA